MLRRPSRARNLRALILTPVLATLLVPPLIPRPAAAASVARFAFSQRQAGGTTAPVGWNPCRTIPVRVDPTSAPPGAMALVRQALADVVSASGLRLFYGGRAGTRQGYGILIDWTTPSRTPTLAGATVGLGSSRWRQRGSGLRHYTTGTVLLDGPALLRMSAGRRLGILEHELGHAMGLAHVSDPNELMYPVAGRIHRYAAGDRAGLARLGRLPCS